MRSDHPVLKWSFWAEVYAILSIAVIVSAGALAMTGGPGGLVLIYLAIGGLILLGLLSVYFVRHVYEIRKLRSKIAQLEGDQFTKEKEAITGDEAQRQSEEILKKW